MLQWIGGGDGGGQGVCLAGPSLFFSLSLSPSLSLARSISLSDSDPDSDSDVRM